MSALVTFAASPRLTPWALEFAKGFTVMAATGCVAVADSASGVAGGNLEYPARFVALVAMMCCLPPLFMTSPAATVVATPAVVLIYIAAFLTGEANRQGLTLVPI